MLKNDASKSVFNANSNTRGNDKEPLVAPSQEVLESEHFQIKVRNATNLAFIEAKEAHRNKGVYAKNEPREYSTRMFQRDIEDTIYEFDNVYQFDNDDCLRKMSLPDLSEALGDDTRWLRDFMSQHRKRKDYYKLIWLAVFIGIIKPYAYEGLISIY
ncbi:hypothetical protein EYS14_13460 [Alteromonadaceae bacterium M269]|nr:hypothetical protein EYS14_13460 [Alteromonadaceae bacterium M269]